jgi:hypothetical protein
VKRLRLFGQIRRPRTLTLQTTLLFLVSLVPVLLISGWVNYGYSRDALETSTRV